MRLLVDHVIEVVGQEIGLAFTDKSRSMVESRLQSRLIQLRLSGPEDYMAYLKANWEKEFDELIAMLTTHHTYFYREPIHFEILERELPRLVSDVKNRGGRRIRVLSAACSYGQEAYSIAMVLHHHLAQLGNPVDFEVLGIDVDKHSIAKAKEGVYKKTDLDQTPLVYIKNHWAPGKGAVSDLVKARKTIRDRCRFRTGNLLKLDQDRFLGVYDIVFCRNVFIYFQNEQIENTVKQIRNHMEDEGLFITGLSEPIDYERLGFKTKGSTSYFKTNKIEKPSVTKDLADRYAPKVSEPKKGPIKVFAIDDSKTVLKILQKIISTSKDFEWAGSALSAKEAIETLKTTDVDVITLDIHMPEIDGLTFLARHHNTRKTPVVMISSAKRDDAQLALRALELGASDFVEKPTIHNLDKKTEEILTKVKTAHRIKASNSLSRLSYDRKHSRSNKMSSIDNKMVIFSCSLNSKDKVFKELRKFSRPHPPILILFDEANFLIPELAEKWAKRLGSPISQWQASSKFTENSIFVASMSQFMESSIKGTEKWNKAVAIYEGVPRSAQVKLRRLRNAEFLLEEFEGRADKDSPLSSKADIVPATSFAYLATEILNKKSA